MSETPNPSLLDPDASAAAGGDATAAQQPPAPPAPPAAATEPAAHKPASTRGSGKTVKPAKAPPTDDVELVACEIINLAGRQPGETTWQRPQDAEEGQRLGYWAIIPATQD